ncbi:hypothetical protein AB0J80_34445 [Actinoplanes sp. NPDC049548]|uniref:hypothetical protein n=1 Tax=Actinoplanes sp. NPDC049548 TaxID=3155152 RepID=UPI003439D550
MSKGASPRSLGLAAVLSCLVTVGAGAAFVRYSNGPEPAGETEGSDSRCASTPDSQLAQTLADLSFITAHPEPAEVAEQGSGCDGVDGQIFAVRTYHWERLDPRQVVTFYQTIAAQDGWTPGHFADKVNEDASGVDPADQGLGAFLCLTKQIGERPAFMQLYFDDSSEYGPMGDVYVVLAWLPGASEPLGC